MKISCIAVGSGNACCRIRNKEKNRGEGGAVLGGGLKAIVVFTLEQHIVLETL